MCPALAGGFSATALQGKSPKHFFQFSSVQSLSCVQLFATPWTAARQASLSITDSQNLLKLMPIESVMPSSHLILCRPLLLLPPIPPSIRVFSNESTLCIRWPKDWSFSFSISPSNEHPGLISFRMDWLDLLAVQGTLKGLPQHHSSKASIFRHSAFLTVQLSHPYMTTGKTIALTFVGKVMSLLFNMLSRLVITFLPRSKSLLISCLELKYSSSVFCLPQGPVLGDLAERLSSRLGTPSSAITSQFSITSLLCPSPWLVSSSHLFLLAQTMYGFPGAPCSCWVSSYLSSLKMTNKETAMFPGDPQWKVHPTPP